jgi:phosphoribosylamine---glycine ligase
MMVNGSIRYNKLMSKKLKILVVGSGGREHAISWKLSRSSKVERLYVAPGNAGTTQVAENVDIKATDITGLMQFAKQKEIDLTIVGPDDPLAAGIVDEFQRAGLKIFGPTKAAARIESSKAFSKQLMAEQVIPTAKFAVFSDEASATRYLQEQNFPMVVKASGLALGKGVFICQSLDEGRRAVEAIMSEKVFGEAGNEVVIEEYLEGPEVSICDGTDLVLFPSSQDHKPIYDGDKGPNTGGMGTIAPVPWFSNQELEKAKQIVRQTLKGLERAGSPFSGCLYPGLKITSSGAKVLEFNARFGDPETQVYMRLLETDLVEVIEACLDHRLGSLEIKWKPGFAVCIVLASGGYPGEYQKGVPVNGLEELATQKDIVVFHAGTTRKNGVVTSGGRVLSVTATGKTLEHALEKAYQAVGLVHFEGMQYRHDIGRNSLKS